MHVNYEYFLQKCRDLKDDEKALDYGCGSATIVEAAIKENLNVVGADVFYEGSDSKKVVSEKGLLNENVFEIIDGKIPFDDESFDLVYSNQVFEHVEDLPAVLSEINRILKKEGVLVTMFPSKEVWREGHCGIPFWHWFSKLSSLRYPYGLFFRTLGFGYHKKDKSKSQWVRDFMQWLDDYTFYRKQKEIEQAFGQYFQFELKEDDYVDYRLKHTGRNSLAKLFACWPFKPVGKILIRKLQSLLIVAKKK